MKLIFPISFIFSLLFCIDAASQIKYAIRVTDFSTQYSTAGYGAHQAAGAPNSTACADAGTAWCPSSSGSRREFLELEYADPVPINRIFVHENLSPGAVDTIYVMNPNTQQWEKVFETTAANLSVCSRILVAVFPATTFAVSKVRITLNSPLVNGWNEIDAVGVALYTVGGVIGSDQTVCAMVQPAAFTSVDPAFNGNPAVVYQWQDSTANGSWQSVNGANAATYQAPIVVQHTWFRRRAELNGTIVFSNSVKLAVVQNGDASEFPLHQWNFYAYQSDNIGLTGAVYKGFYTRATLNFNTVNDWHYIVSPSAAAGFQGCTVPADYFVLSARRKGFPVGNYVLSLPSFRMNARVYVNGILVSDLSCCAASVSLGALDEQSEIEIRLQDAGSQAYLSAEFQLAGLSGGDIGESQLVCINQAPSLLVSNTDAFGGAAPASITYQWQDSVANGNWKNIENATNKTYQPGALPVTTWFRRRAADNTGATAFSDELRITVGSIQGDTAVYGNQSWVVYAFNGNDISLATNSYQGFYTATGLTVNTVNSFPSHLSPSAAPNYTGCPVNNDDFVISARRQGFPAGSWMLQITNADDYLMVLVNGVQIHAGRAGNIRVGELDANSKVELRLRETNNSANLEARFVQVENNVSDFVNINCNFYYLHFADQNGWYHFTDPVGKLVLSFHPNGNDLGTMELYTKHFGTGIAGIPSHSVTNKKYLPRNFRLRSFNYPSGNFPNPVKLRLYFKNSEFEDYRTAINDPSLTRDQLGMAHYSGDGEDCEYFNNVNGGVLLTSPVVGDIAGTGFYLEASTTSFSEFGVLAGSPALPVNLTSFKAQTVSKGIELTWTTSQELQNKGFEVLRSEDGRQFRKIGWVDGQGTSSLPHQYNFTDASPLAGKNFYRLRQMDIDGNASLSGIAAASITNTVSLSLSPNPVDHTLYIEYDVKNTASLKILDLQGRVAWSRQGPLSASLLAVPVHQFAKGIYLLEITDKQGRKQVQKFVKK